MVLSSSAAQLTTIFALPYKAASLSRYTLALSVILARPLKCAADRPQDRPPLVVELFGRRCRRRRYPMSFAPRASSN